MPKKTKKLSIITPATLPQVDFSDFFVEYKENVKSLSAYKQEKEQLLGRSKTFLRKYLASKPTETELSSLVEKIVVYKQLPKLSVKKNVKDYFINTNSGYSPTLSRFFDRLIKEEFGKKGEAFLHSVEEYAVYQSMENEIDEEATAKAREEFQKIAERYDEICTEIGGLEAKINQTKEYISVFKDVASIASLSKKE